MSHRMKALIEIDPAKARAEITDAFTKARCHYQDAAALLGATAQTYRRWARLLGVKGKLEALDEKARKQGWHHGRTGGAGFHKDPTERVAKSLETRRLNAKARSRVVKQKPLAT